MKKIKLLLVVPTMELGGAERVLLNIAKYINSDKFKVSMLLFEKKGPYLNQLPKNITVFDLKSKNSINPLKIMYRILKIRIILKKYRFEKVLSFTSIANINLLLSSIGLKNNDIICSERISPNYFKHSYSWKRTLIYKLYLLILPKIYYYLCKTLIIQTQEIYDHWASLKIPESKMHILPNLFDIKEIERKSKETFKTKYFHKDQLNLISVGRLHPQKNYDMVIKIGKKLLNQKISFKWIILGEGSCKDQIQTKINKSKLENNIFLLGTKKNPFKYIRSADIFLLTSHYEGFPNVLVESMICETTIISTNCPSGPKDIINHGKNGFLVEINDVNATVEYLIYLNDHKTTKKTITQEAKKTAEKFNINTIIKKLELIINE